ncbi:DinB family protein [Brevibacillus invocatus]|uniref:DinB family protein n=1 Tax=Brevibacillus invocatus TaxID=173959 RepID=A0A3M8CH14_9BACL|nr:DinB family protein [Brevibacillus invocatus]RNB74939.1 DinB family protein [Brevibacillus invocatus]
MSTAILNSGKSIRKILVHQLQSLPEEYFNVQPVPFNNTVNWNVGHIIVSLNTFLSLCGIDTIDLPEGYPGLYKMGTKPADWTDAPPSKEELLQYLTSQLNHLSEVAPEALEGALNSPITMGPLQFEQKAELCNFAFVHEAMHASTIASLLKVIKHQESATK